MSFEDEQRRQQQLRQKQREIESNKQADLQSQMSRMKTNQTGENIQGLFENHSMYDSRIMELAKAKMEAKAAAEAARPPNPIKGQALDQAIMGAGQMQNNIRDRDAMSEQERFELANRQQQALDAQADARDEELKKQQFLKLNQQLGGQ